MTGWMIFMVVTLAVVTAVGFAAAVVPVWRRNRKSEQVNLVGGRSGFARTVDPVLLGRARRLVHAQSVAARAAFEDGR